MLKVCGYTQMIGGMIWMLWIFVDMFVIILNGNTDLTLFNFIRNMTYSDPVWLQIIFYALPPFLLIPVGSSLLRNNQYF